MIVFVCTQCYGFLSIHQYYISSPYLSVADFPPILELVTLPAPPPSTPFSAPTPSVSVMMSPRPLPVQPPRSLLLTVPTPVSLLMALQLFHPLPRPILLCVAVDRTGRVREEGEVERGIGLGLRGVLRWFWVWWGFWVD